MRIVRLEMNATHFWRAGATQLLSRCMMSVMLCLQMHGIYKCWRVLMVGFFVERVNSERT